MPTATAILPVSIASEPSDCHPSRAVALPNCPARRATRILRYADSQRTAHACAPGLLVNHLGQQLDKWRGSRRNSSRGRLEASYNFSGANFVVYDEGLKHEAINAAEPAACGARVLNKSMTRRIPMTMRILVPSLDLLLLRRCRCVSSRARAVPAAYLTSLQTLLSKAQESRAR